MFLIYYLSSSSVQFSCSVMSDSLGPHEPQHTRPPIEFSFPNLELVSFSISGSNCCFLICSKISADDDCSYEFKRHLLLERKITTNLNSILKSRDSTLSTKVHLVKAMVFPVVMYGCESWTIKKAKHRRIFAFELWCWRRLLRRRSHLDCTEIQPVHSK